jgi:hypothetical protein
MMIKFFSWMMVLALSACGAAEQTSAHDHAINQSPTVDQAPANPPTAPPAPNDPQQPPQDPAASQPPAAANPVESLLDKLERSAADLNAFTAKVTYDKQDAVLGRPERRTGELIYRVDPDTKRKTFAILFDSVIIGQRKRNDLKHYIFDGRWLVEINPKEKQFIKREIVAPGKELDPLKLGEGPFPLPIGQAKSEVLARFDVTPAEVPQQGLLKDLKNVDGLTLVPKPGTREARDFAKVVLFYDKQTSLPIGIHTMEPDGGDEKTILLGDVQRNPQLDEAAQSKLNIQEPDPREWKIDVRPWNAGE